ncbi:MAG: transporter substrate-binding domain-containing protein [Chlorobiaceae bacterium]|nr:transporter substrate-binding domain-containing protein [Chlorobiaceae bacterium]
MTTANKGDNSIPDRLPNRFVLLIIMAVTVASLVLGGLWWHNRDSVAIKRDLNVIRNSKKLKVLLSYDPINYFIYSGTPMGYSYELAESFAKELGIPLEVVVVRDLNQQLAMLRKGECDIVSHFLTITGPRSGIVDFSSPLDSTRQVLIQRKPGKNDSTRLVRKIEELDGKNLHVRTNSAYFTRLKEIMKDKDILINIVDVQGTLTTSELISKVNDGSIDYTVADDNIASTHSALYPNIDFATPLSPTQPLAWAVRKNSPQLLQALNLWLEKEKKSGRLAVIHDKYYNRQYQFRKHAAHAFYSSHAGRISPYDELVRKGAKTIDWDWRLLSALIYEESQFDPEAISWAGAIGLMQLMPSTAAAFKPGDLSNPADNIKAGTAYLVSLEKEWEEIQDQATRLKFILASYNVGPGHVRDAQKLATKYGANPYVWEGNVERYLELKAEPGFYNDKASLLGYCNGKMAVLYTRNIINRYTLYSQVIPE